MARTISTIQNEIIAAKNADANLAALNSTSAVAIWRLWTFVMATCQWTLEKLMDAHVVSVNATIATLKPHTLQWYAEKAKAFQYGYSLFDDEDYYDNTGIDEATIAASKVVKHAAAIETVKGVRLKVAGETSGDLAPLSAPQLAALQTYMARVKDAGVKMYYTNAAADSLKLNYQIYYDPLILDAAGQRIDGAANTPVQDAIEDFLKNDLPFNGVFLPSKLTDKLQLIEGVNIPHLVTAQATYGALPYSTIAAHYTPDAGYLRIVNPTTDLTLTFIPS